MGTNEPATTTPAFPEWSPKEPFETITIGTDSAGDPQPHTYTIWNHDDEARTIHVTITQNGSVVLDKRYDFPAQGSVKIVLATPANYEVTVGIAGTDRGPTIVDPIEFFDCNTRGVHVAIMEGGTVRQQSYSTEMYCRTETATTTPTKSPTPDPDETPTKTPENR